MTLLKSVCISNVTTSAIRFRAPTARRTALKQRLCVYRMMYYGRLMLVSTLFSFYSISAQRLTRLTTKSFSRNYIESASKVTHIAGSSLTSPTETWSSTGQCSVPSPFLGVLCWTIGSFLQARDPLSCLCG